MFFGLRRARILLESEKTPPRRGTACAAAARTTHGKEWDSSMKILKRAGNFVIYDDEKVVRSILRANEGTGEALSPRAAEYLADNDAYHALQITGRLIITGPTGTNVNDVAVALLRSQ